MTDVVTRLIVRADGSLATLDRFEKGMGDAGKATDYASGAVASFEKRMEAARAATERGLAVSTQSVARKSQEERAWEKWSATVDRTTGLRIRLEREAATAAAAAANAVNLGYASQEQALNTLMALERRHAAQLSAHIAAENNVAVAYNRTAQAADQAAASTARLSAANQNDQYRGAGNFNTGNVAAQFQDIGVTAAMGMSPVMIALQQGTQLSAVLGGQGLTGVVKTLGAAFASILSPVSLLTIGVVALAAWGIQAFMGMMKGADTATTSLEKHNEWLDKVLAGYDSVRDAADSALEAALKLPQASAESDLAARQEAASTRALAAMEKAVQIRGQFEAMAGYASSGAFGIDPKTTEQLIAVNDVIAQITEDSQLSRLELDQFHTALTLLSNNTSDKNLKAIAAEALVLVDAARAASAEVSALDAGLSAIDRDINVRINVSQVFSGAMEDINSLYIDPRSRFDQAREELKLRSEAAQNSAQTTSELTALASNYERVLSSINAAEAEANKKSEARGASAAAKPPNQWGGNVDQFQQRLATQRMEIELLGQSTYEIERQKAAFDLLNQAKQAGIPITSDVTDQINLMSSEYAAATVELERMQEQQRANEEQMNFYRSTFSGFFSDLKGGLKEGQSFWEALGNAGANALDKIADRALSMATNGIFDMIFGSIMGGITGGLGGNSLGGGWGVAGGFGGRGIFGIPGMADGGTVGRAGLSWVGEQGPELLRLPQGAQVIPNAPSMAMAANQKSGDVYITNQINVPAGTSADVAPAIAREVTNELRKQLPDAIQSYNRNPLRRAG